MKFLFALIFWILIIWLCMRACGGEDKKPVIEEITTTTTVISYEGSSRLREREMQADMYRMMRREADRYDNERNLD